MKIGEYFVERMAFGEVDHFFQFIGAVKAKGVSP